MTHPFDPHPLWRRNFLFTAAYTQKDPDYKLDPIIEYSKPTVEFTLDPTIHKFSDPLKSSV